jgi:hypothetical protein
MAARLLFGGAGLLLIFSACSDSKGPTAGSATANTVAATTVAPVPASVAAGTTTTLVAVGPTVAPADGPAMLQQAVAATGVGYHFEQSASVDGVVAVSTFGDRLTDGARFSVTRDGLQVFYTITPGGTYVMPEGQEWTLDDSPAPAVDPIDALKAPSAVAITANDGTTVQLTATVNNTQLGIPDVGETPLQLTIVSGALTNIAFNTTTSDGRTVVTTTAIGPAQDTSPVVAPI